jgi:predicted restriction endonuclease
MPDDKFAEFAAKFSNEQERLDVNNGLLLVATLDALFDRELVSFKDGGEVIISSRVNIDEVALVMHPEKRNLRNELLDAQRRYLAGHRREVFQE